MKKYYPVDFDEKGNAVLGTPKNTPTSNGFVPTTWTPGGGGDEGKNGLKSITISPAITTTPALDSLFPIYWEDLTEEQKQSGINYHGDAVGIGAGNEFTITVTPTSDWYAWQLVNGAPVFGGKGEPITFTKESFGNVLEFQCGAANQTEMAEVMAVVNFTASIAEE